MFNNHDPYTNGENLFYEQNKDRFHVIFDVGCRNDSLFLSSHASVYYFEPVPEFLEALQQRADNQNCCSSFHNFGLSDETTTLAYYPKYQSFFDRIQSCGTSDAEHRRLLSVRRADEFLKEHPIERIDFLKIDTEGSEWKVLKGFGDALSIVRIIQFEYGGTFLDNGVRLREVIAYLQSYHFVNFCYLTADGLVPLKSDDDHYQYCNIVCFNQLLI